MTARFIPVARIDWSEPTLPCPAFVDPDWLDAALCWTAEDQAAACEGSYAEARQFEREFPWIQLAQKLAWKHGPNRALRLMGWRDAA